MSCQRVLPVALGDDRVLAAHHLHLDPLPRMVSEARAFVRQHAPALPDDVHDALLLLTSELVTNAVLHARTPIELGITVAEGSVLVTVHDLDLARPVQRPYDGREGGWGLGLVSALADECDLVVHDGDGKTAWFRISRSGGRPVPDAAARRDEGRA